MLVCEASGRYIQSSISETNDWNVTVFKNLVTNFSHVGFVERYAIEGLLFCINVQL
jgi:hypothetical protein